VDKNSDVVKKLIEIEILRGLT